MNLIADMPEGAKKAVFAAVAALLLGLAFFATRGAGDDPAGSKEPPAVTTSTTDTVVPQPSGTASDTGDTTGDTPASGAVDQIDLPIDADDLAATKALAAKFTQAYTTYSYNQDDAAALKRLKGMLDDKPLVNVADAIPTGSFKSALVADRYATTSKATVTALNTVSKNLVVYEVDATVTTTRAGKTSQKTTGYLVTVTKGVGWGVYDLRPEGGSSESSASD